MPPDWTLPESTHPILREEKPACHATTALPTALEGLDSAGRAEFWAALALLHTQGLGARSCRRLLELFGSALETVRQHSQWRKADITDNCSRAFASGAWRGPAKVEWDAARTLRGSILLWTDSHYPQRLKELPDAPVRLYCQGNISLLSAPCIGIVGTRNCTQTGTRTAAIFAGALAASGLTIVSGMARGIDRAAHLAAVDMPGSTIAVLGTGLDVNYPSKNSDLRQKIAKSGLLISEYAPGTPPEARLFPIRNRIISGLSFGVLVVEAAVRSGSLITAKLALEQNRSVYAIAGGIGEKYAAGCQELIRQGAQAVFSSKDIILDLAPQLQDCIELHPTTPPAQTVEQHVQTKQRDTALPFVQKQLLCLLGQGMPYNVDECCQLLHLKAEQISSALVILEVNGMVRQLSDMRYELM